MAGVENFLVQKVEEMIAKAKEENPKKKPLVRVRVDYTGFEKLSAQRFGQHFVGKVANPSEVLLLSKKKTISVRGNNAQEILDSIVPEKTESTRIEDLIPSFIKANQTILPEHDLNRALQNFVNKQDNTALNT